MSESLVRRLSRRFSRRGTSPRRRRRDFSDGKCRDKDSIPCKVILLDGTNLSFNLAKKSIGMELITLVNKNLDLVEKYYFGLQFTDSLQVIHWLDPLKKIKKQMRGALPYTFNFRVKFYAAEPHSLDEELTRYHFFLQLKQDILENRLQAPLKKVVELAAYSLQSELGDHDPELHQPNYVSNFKFIPEQTAELEREIKRKHKLFAGLNPAECEVHFLKIIKSLEFYGIVQYEVLGDKNRTKYHLGLSPKGLVVINDVNTQVATHAWPRITSMSFRRNRFNIAVENKETPTLSESFSFTLSSAKASKQLWKAAVEYHAFFRLIKIGEQPATTMNFLRRGSKFRFSGRTQFQAANEAKLSARKAMKIERTRSERYTKRSTVGYIRVGSRVWAKALNGDYYKGTVTGLGEKVHIKFNNDDTIAHERDTEDCVIFDMEPNPEDIDIGTRLIAHWPSIAAYLSGTVIKVEGQKYYVHYDDGDKGWNNIRQVRILKPPLYFGPGANYRAKVNKSESFKETSMTARPITVEKPLKAKQAKHAMEAKDHASKGHQQPKGSTNAGDGNHYNERKISYSERKGSENQDVQRHNGQHRQPTAKPTKIRQPTEKPTKLEQILNMANVATDVDTGEPVFVEEEEKRRYKQMSKTHHNASDEHSIPGKKLLHQGRTSAPNDQGHYASKSSDPPITEL